MPRTVNQALIDAVAAENVCAIDLWTLKHADGTDWVWWTTHSADVAISPVTWSSTAPTITRGTVRLTTGTEVSTLDVTLQGGFLISGSTIAALAATGSFDDIPLTYERLYLPTWATSPSDNYKILLFTGYVYEVEPSSTQVKLTAKSIMARASEEIPRRQYGPMCAWQWGETRCGIDIVDYQGTDSVNATGTTVLLVHLTTGTSPWLRDGSRLTFSDGQRRIAVDWNGTTKVATLDSPLPAIPSGSVTIHYSCNKTKVECDTGFDNLVHFGGFLSIPS